MIWNKNKKNNMRVVHPIIYIYVGVFVLIIVLLFSNSIGVIESINNDRIRNNYFESLPIKAQSVYIYDIQENKVVYAKNEHTPLPLASITKLMSVYCALDNVDENKIITVPKSVFEPFASSTPEISELWKIRDLAIYTLIESSNAGAELLAESSLGMNNTIDCMNKVAEEMELFETKFFNVTGLDIDGDRSGAYGSAENVASMLHNIYTKYPAVLGMTSYPSYDIYSLNGIIHTAENTNVASREITGLLASKTGFTDISGGNLTFIMNASLQHKVVVVILGSTQEERFTDALVISKAIIEPFSK